MAANSPDDSELLNFPGHPGVPDVPRMMSIRAIQLMIENMLNYAACSPDAYFDVGPMEGMADGSLQFDYEGLWFRITIEQVPNPFGGPLQSPGDSLDEGDEDEEDDGPSIRPMDPDLN